MSSKQGFVTEREMEVRVCFWMLLSLPLTAVTGPLGETESERNPSEDLTPARSQSGGPASCTHSSTQHILEDMPCAKGVDQPSDTLGGVLFALKNIWNGSELTKQELCQFGVCSDSHDDPRFFSLITKMVQEEYSLEYMHSKKEKKIGLDELQTIMCQRNGKSRSPVIVLFSKKSDHETVPRSNKTFLFLCELQTFLNEISPSGNPLLAQDEVQSISPSVLYSLPPLTLGASSSESLLLELVNSSGPTVFYFSQSIRLRTHRVELALNPSLVSMLKSKLDEALMRVRTEEFGQSVIEKLQILSVLGGLPEELETGVENQPEVQYRALLLLKALQAVLDAWAVERAQRAARAGQEESTRFSQCHLESFTVSLEKYLLEPATANINNCEGTCGFPLINGNNHAILLNSHLQSGQPLNRTLCCVPVAYDDLCVIELHSDSTTISYKTNMVAKECGCR
ncbi:Muellerian-inhibiting factor [Bagarius yarrelli]|uniref:Muellerian-inhibiting factor n=1 Tax=Bagarius yarrelli TaxID=175774 RepID=A0A556VCJ3_BAGYA|nr:Muellerian-inhibiting factor [Bagarius yarrelli]